MFSDCPLCFSQAKLFSHSQGRPFYLCEECGLIHLSPQNHLSQQDEMARYQKHQNHPQDTDYRAFLNRLADPLAKLLPAGSKGLDYGCGPGPTLSVMMEELGFLMKNYDPYFFKDDSLLNEKYDFVTCTEATEHFYFPRKEFDRLNTLLFKGGWLAIMTSIYEKGIDFQGWHYAKDPTHVSIYTEKSWEWLARNYGWRVQVLRSGIVFFKKPH